MVMEVFSNEALILCVLVPVFLQVFGFAIWFFVSMSMVACLIPKADYFFLTHFMPWLP